MPEKLMSSDSEKNKEKMGNKMSMNLENPLLSAIDQMLFEHYPEEYAICIIESSPLSKVHITSINDVKEEISKYRLNYEVNGDFYEVTTTQLNVKNVLNDRYEILFKWIDSFETFILENQKKITKTKIYGKKVKGN